MDAKTRIALVYGLSALGAGAFSYYRGREITDIFKDAAIQGLVFGTGANVAVWLVSEYPGASTAITNTVSGMGSLSGDAVKLLSNLDTEALYSTLKENGVKIAMAPLNPDLIRQDSD